MEEAQSTDGMRPRALSQTVRRHWALIVIVIILVTITGAALVAHRAHKYKSTATVLVQPLAGNAFSVDAANSNNSQSSTVAMQTEASLVDSIAVTAKVNSTLKAHLGSASSLVTAQVPKNTELIQISYTARTRQAAQSYAQAYAVAFLDYRAGLAAAAQRAQLANLNAQAASAGLLLKQASVVAAGSHPPADANSKVQVYASRLASIQEDIGQVQALSSNPGTVVSPARQPQSASGIGPLLTSLGIAVFGLLLGLFLAFWRERRDDRIRAADDSSISDLPVLGTVPVDRDNSIAPVGTPLDPYQDEAFRRARTALLSSAATNSVIGVAAVSSAEASAEVAVHLARTLSAAGYRTVLVDAAIATGHIAPLMGIDDSFGLSDVLVSHDLNSVELIDVEGIRVLPAGSNTAGAREQYSGAALSNLLSKLAQDSDYLLVSTGPVIDSDGLAAVLAVERVLLVVTDRMTTHDEVADASSAIRRLGVHMLGLIVMRRSARIRRPTMPARTAKPASAAEAADAGSGLSTPSAPPPDHPDWIWEEAPNGSTTLETAGSENHRGFAEPTLVDPAGNIIEQRDESEPVDRPTNERVSAQSATTSAPEPKRRPMPYTPVRRQPKGPS